MEERREGEREGGRERERGKERGRERGGREGEGGQLTVLPLLPFPFVLSLEM